MSMERALKAPSRLAILLLAVLVALAGCGEKKPEEQPPKSEPAPQAAPPPAIDPRPGPEQPSTSSVPAKPEAVPQRPKQEPGPAAEPPAIVREARKPETPRPEAKPTPTEEPKPIPTEAAKPAPTAPATPQKPAAAEPTKAVVRDVMVLTGSPMGGVRLQHKLHAARAGNNCATCHHASKPQKPAAAPQQACSDCHTKAAAQPMKTKYQAAFHNPTAQSGTCIDCHKAESAKAKKAPLKCVECHKKENK
jgi:predicted small lipoprotein YifL